MATAKCHRSATASSAIEHTRLTLGEELARRSDDRPFAAGEPRSASCAAPTMTDWVRFAELVNEMGQLIDAGQTEGPELQRVVNEAGAILQSSEADALDAFVIDDPWTLLEGSVNGRG